MNRRNILKSFLAGVAALVTGNLFARKSEIVDTTSMHNKLFRTSDVVEEAPVLECVNIDCDDLRIEHRGCGLDGYLTVAILDGASPYIEANGNKLLEKTIEFFCTAGETPVVKVLYHRRSPTGEWLGDVYATIRANRYYLKCKDLEVFTHIHRGPCMILIGGMEPFARDVHVMFAEGELPWVTLVMKPQALLLHDDDPLPISQGPCFAPPTIPSMVVGCDRAVDGPDFNAVIERLRGTDAAN